jgi:hypothetical protein
MILGSLEEGASSGLLRKDGSAAGAVAATAGDGTFGAETLGAGMGAEMGAACG